MSRPEDKLLTLVSLLSEFHNLVNTCSVDFIVKDLYSTVLPESVQSQLSSMSEDQLASLPSSLMEEGREDVLGKMGKVVSKLREHSLEKLSLVREVESETTDSLLDHFDKIMPPKKTHEVCNMFKLVRDLAEQTGSSCLMDLGSGKGYLSQALAALAGLPVLAVDGQESNSKGAQLREENLQTRWKGLKARAEDRSEGREVSNRKKRRQERKERRLEEEQGQEGKTEDGEVEGKGKEVVNLTHYVEAGSDCSGLIQKHLGEDYEMFGLIGLHTCGDLASTSLRTIVASPGAAFLCNVGCCYHHLTERFYSHPFLSSQTSKDAVAGFPLSSTLVSKKYWLGRSARMLACQPLSRLASKPSLPTDSLLWRASLQVLLSQHAPHLSEHEVQVGRLAGKSKHFTEYVRKAFTVIGSELPDTIDDEHLSEFYREQETRHRKRLAAFHQFRALFAPLVENIILLDRLCYLREQAEIKDCYIVRLFDCTISPRAYGIVATRA